MTILLKLQLLFLQMLLLSIMRLMQVSYINNLEAFLLCRVLGVWLIAENKIRQWALTYSEIYVISGSVLGENRRDHQDNYDW